MSNKSKSQQQQQQQQQQTGQGQSHNQIVSQQQQQQHQQQQYHHQQQPQQQQTQQQQQVKDVTLAEPVPPRYQPPPQPSSGILKSQQPTQPSTLASYGGSAGIGSAAAALARHQQLQQLQQQHQQQATRLASQVKDAVQSKFIQNIELPHRQIVRADKLAGGFGLPQGKNFLPMGISKPSTALNSNTPIASTIGGLTPTATVATSSNVHPLTINGQSVPRSRVSDDEFLRLGPGEMLKFVRKTESDLARLAADQHRQIQSLINELRVLKEANQRLNDDNQELRDLCCFLDDDRQKGRKLAREWQRFGRYTASVMRQEVSAYQNKLRQLDNKQQELIKDNLELKELCLYLDEERGGGQRDDGDGSSSSTNADETAPQPPRVSRQHTSSTFNDQTMQYVKSLEQRVKQLEEDKSVLQARAQGWTVGPNEVWENPHNPNDDFHLGSRPEAVVRALQVLEVREQLEREAGHDGEKALIREMCNVVWRKLEEGPVRNNRI